MRKWKENIKKIIGASLLASPFIFIAITCFRDGGWREFVFVFGTGGLIVAVVVLGAFLISPNRK